MHMNLSKLRETVKDRGAQSAAVHRVVKSQTQLSNWTMTTTGKLGIRPPHTSFWSLILHKEIFCVFSLIVTVSRLHVVLSPHKTVVNKMGPELATDSLQCIPNLQGWWCLRWGGSMGRKQEKGKVSSNWFKITITIIFNIYWLYTICEVHYAIISFNFYNNTIFAHFTDEEMRALVDKKFSNTATASSCLSQLLLHNKQPQWSAVWLQFGWSSLDSARLGSGFGSGLLYVFLLVGPLGSPVYIPMAMTGGWEGKFASTFQASACIMIGQHLMG